MTAVKEFLYRLRLSVRCLLLLDPQPEPDEDEESNAALRQWVARGKHPDACRVGCQCRFDGG